MSAVARLVARNLGSAPSLRPRPLSLFEPDPHAASQNRLFSQLAPSGSLPFGNEIEREEFNEQDRQEPAVRSRPRDQARSGWRSPTVESGGFEAQEGALQERSSSKGLGEAPAGHRVPSKSSQILDTVMNPSLPTKVPLDETNLEDRGGDSIGPPPLRAFGIGDDLIAEQNAAPALSHALESSPRPTAPVLRGRTVSGTVSPSHREPTPKPDIAPRATAEIGLPPARNQRKIDPMLLLSPKADRRNASPPATEAEPAPSIHVTIGRVEIRAETPAAPPRKAERGASPVMGLEEYLRRKNKRGNE